MSDYYLNFLIFGLPTWALVDGTWVSLSQLASHAPEGYTISAYLILSLTLGNLFPIILGYKLKYASEYTLKLLIKFILVAGFICGILLAGLWNQTATIGGDSISLPLFILFFFVGVCSSTSNVTHFTFVSTFAAENTTALATGMGVGSMIAGLLGILQGLVLINYGFSTTYFYLVLALLYVPAYYSFSLFTIAGKPPSSKNLENVGMLRVFREDEGLEYEEFDFVVEHGPILLLQLLISSLGYGVVPAIISFACGKFNNSSLVLLFATSFAAIIDPICRSFTNYWRLHTSAHLMVATMVLLFLTIGLLICACAPSGSSLYEGYGGVLPVVLYVSFVATFGFTNTCIFRHFKDNVTTHVQHIYRWNGMFSQIGALIGSLVAFIIVITNSL